MSTTAPTTQTIDIAYPGPGDLELVLRVGPCRLSFRPTDGPAWISGTYDDASGMLPLQVTTGQRTVIAQGFDLALVRGAALPRLDLAIARQRPFSLELQAGASEAMFDLGGLPIARLAVKAGAGRFEIDFTQPNPAMMTLLDLSAGAGALTAKHLANANFAAMRYGGGVSACTLDFSGTLARDGAVRIDAGLGSVDLSVPAETAMRVRSKSFAAGVRAAGGFTRRDDTYVTTPGARDQHPMLDVEASLAFGALNLTTI